MNISKPRAPASVKADGHSWYLHPDQTPNRNIPVRPEACFTIPPSESGSVRFPDLLVAERDDRRALALPWGCHRVVWGQNWGRQTDTEIKATGTSGSWEHGVDDPTYAARHTKAPLKVDYAIPNLRIIEPYPTVPRRWVPELETLPDQHLEPITGCRYQRHYVKRANEEFQFKTSKPAPSLTPWLRRGKAWCSHLNGGGKCRNCMTSQDVVAIQRKRLEMAGKGYYGRILSGI